MAVTKTEIDLVRMVINKNRAWAKWLDVIVDANTGRNGWENTAAAESLAGKLRDEADEFEQQLIDIAKEAAKD